MQATGRAHDLQAQLSGTAGTAAARGTKDIILPPAARISEVNTLRGRQRAGLDQQPVLDNLTEGNFTPEEGSHPRYDGPITFLCDDYKRRCDGSQRWKCAGALASRTAGSCSLCVLMPARSLTQVWLSFRGRAGPAGLLRLDLANWDGRRNRHDRDQMNPAIDSPIVGWRHRGLGRCSSGPSKFLGWGVASL